MPIPTPKAEQEQSEYMEECMSFLKHEAEPKPHKQRVAICLNTWREAKGIKEGEEMDIIEKIDKYLEEAEKTPMQCIECGKKFSKKIGPKTYEVKCPKCGSFDTEPILQRELTST